jgi:hypothetical protein
MYSLWRKSYRESYLWQGILMPAISPSRLKIQTARLAEQFTQPGIFVRQMHELLRLYADQTYRHGQAGSPSALIESYNIPQPVMRQIWITLKPLANHNPQATLELCDTLWSESNFEHRLLACMLLGFVPINQPEAISQRIEKWSQSIPQQNLSQSVINFGMVRLRREAPDTLMELIEEWLNSSKTEVKQLGVRALIYQVEEPGFQNIPGVFRLLTSLIHNPPSSIRPELIELLRILAVKLPNETAYLLKNSIISSNNPDVAWLARQVLPAFPDQIKDNLRKVMKNINKDRLSG